MLRRNFISGLFSFLGLSLRPKLVEEVKIEEFEYNGKKYWWGDWITPGEMLWDTTGTSLIPSNAFKLKNETWSIKLMISKWLHGIADWFYKLPAKSDNVHQLLLEQHLRVARLRHSLGLSPKFWIKNGDSHTTHLMWDSDKQKMIAIERI